jgi:hypothetical protein
MPQYDLGNIYPIFLYTTGYFKTISIIAHSSSTAKNYWTIHVLSGAGAHGKCAQLLKYGSKHLGQNFFFYCVCLDRSFPEEPSLPRTGYFKTVATIQLV